MKVLKVDHIGVAVNSIDAAMKFFSATLGLKLEGSETVAEQKVTTAFLPVGDTEVELLQSTAPDGLLRASLKRRGKASSTLLF